MKQHLISILLGLAVLSAVSCNNWLNVEPTGIITADQVFATDEGIESFLANIYYNLPIEAFNFAPDRGVNFCPGDANNAGYFTYVVTDDGIGSEHQNVISAGQNAWWGYEENMNVNLFFESIDGLDKSFSESSKNLLKGEAWFARGYVYFALAKRYGGVPIITKVGDVNDSTSLYIPRSKEVETWDYVLDCLDSAANYLPETSNPRRANKYVALALKSRAALHAASLAKYWDNAPLTGDAVDQGLVGGFTDADAQRYYKACIEASEEVIKSGEYSLYKPNPSNAEEATKNYVAMFQDPNNALEEVIFMKGYELQGTGLGSNQDNWGNPNQTKAAWPHPGRFNPSLNLADAYECYSDPGHSAPLRTKVSGDGGVNDTKAYSSITPSDYRHFDSPLDMFADKDARLSATVILPLSEWKGETIVIQGGLVDTDGKLIRGDKGDNQSVTVNGTNYYVYGGSDTPFFSGFSGYGGNMTRTGFGFRKFLDPNYECMGGWNKSTTDYIDIRLAEVYLNYEEAVCESGLGDKALAKDCLNATRHRAAFKDDIPLTLDNVLRERRVELVYEDHRMWDLIRRRTYHEVFNGTKREALMPVLDLSTIKTAGHPQYIFLRENVYDTNPQTFNTQAYYVNIPGTGSNKLVQNPKY